MLPRNRRKPSRIAAPKAAVRRSALRRLTITEFKLFLRERVPRVAQFGQRLQPSLQNAGIRLVEQMLCP